MAEKDAQESREVIINAAFDCAQTYGWDATTYIEIAHHAGMPVSDVQVLFAEKTDILTAYGRKLDERLQAHAGALDPMESCRDRLFDLLMERFDMINEQRAGVLAVLSDICLDPKAWLCDLPHLGRSMAKILDLCGLESGGIRGALRVSGLALVYVSALHVWKSDDSADLSKVMARLDQDLSRAEGFANFLSL